MQSCMEPDGPGWELWRTFDAVMREGSLSAAARVLGLAQPTAGRHVAELEASLQAGVLFVRAGRGLQPTDAAQALAPQARAMVAAAATLVRTASAPADAPAGTVRISASEIVGAEVLPPILTALRRDHPALVIELLLTDAASDLLQRDADMAVRMTVPRQQALLARPVGRIRIGLFAHCDYLARCSPVERIEDLVAHAVVGFDRQEAALRALYPELAKLPAFALRTDNQLAQLAAVRAGFGIGLVQVEIARRNPALKPVLPDAFAAHLDAWVVMHEDLRTTRRMRVVFDALVDGLLMHVRSANDSRAHTKGG